MITRSHREDGITGRQWLLFWVMFLLGPVGPFVGILLLPVSLFLPLPSAIYCGFLISRSIRKHRRSTTELSYKLTGAAFSLLFYIVFFVIGVAGCAALLSGSGMRSNS